MTYRSEKINSTLLKIDIQVPYRDLESLFPKAAHRIAGETEIAGFRKGKAPYDVIKQKFGEFKILEEAARNYIERHFNEIVDKVGEEEFKGQSFEPVGTPSISVTKLAAGEDVEYRVQLHVLPPLTLPDYHAIAKRVFEGKKAPEATREELASAIKWLRESRVKRVTVARASRIGDRVEASFSLTSGGVPIEGGESKHHPFILGESHFIPGFEDFLVGMKSGETKEFSIQVPQDYREAGLAGKMLDIKAEMQTVEERELPEWNDAFAPSLGNFQTIGEVEKSVREGIIAEKEAKEREQLRMTMIDEVAANIKAEIPEPLIERELEKMLAELNQSIERMGLKFDDYLTHIKKTPEDLKKEWASDARKRVLIALALREIAKKEAVQPTDEDIEKTKVHTIGRLGLSEQDLLTIDREAFLGYNRGIARNEKVFEVLENLINE